MDAILGTIVGFFAFGLVWFFLLKPKNNNEINRLNVKLIHELNKTGKIYLSHTMINDIYSIRMPIGSTSVNIDNIKSSWKLIKKVSQDII